MSKIDTGAVATAVAECVDGAPWRHAASCEPARQVIACEGIQIQFITNMKQGASTYNTGRNRNGKGQECEKRKICFAIMKLFK